MFKSNIFILLTFGMLFLPTLSNASTPWKQGLDTLIAERTKDKRFVDGAVSVFSSGKNVTSHYGISREDTIFEIGSITKSFTGILFADLVIRGLIKPEDRVENYIPELAGTFAGSVTLGSLASHTSGISRIPKDLPLNDNPYRDYSEDLFLKALKHEVPPTNSSLPEYSNSGFALLGLVLARVSEVSFAQLLDERISKVLDLKDTIFIVDDSRKDRFIQGYQENLSKASHWDFDVFAPTGGLRSTISDMEKFVSSNLNPNSTQLGPAIQLSQKNNWGWDSGIIGIGFPYKNGGTGGFSTALFVDHSKKLGAVVLTNISYEADSIAVSIIKSVKSDINSCRSFYK